MNTIVQTEQRFTTTAVDITRAISDVGKPVLLAPSQQSAAATEPDDSLYEHFSWLYVFFRERLFRDDTDRFVRTLWPQGRPRAGTRLIELGCGPGFYSCGLAARFGELSVLGVDRSARQLAWAEQKAQSLHLENCCFESDDVLDISHSNDTFDVLLAARLFTVLSDQERAVAEMHRVLRPGGRCLIAEPRYALWASLPLLAMWLLAGVTRMNNGYCEPRQATVLSAPAFRKLFASQPWRQVKTWKAGRYQYALCEKI